jgi:hypothetical protein
MLGKIPKFNFAHRAELSLTMKGWPSGISGILVIKTLDLDPKRIPGPH